MATAYTDQICKIDNFTSKVTSPGQELEFEDVSS